MDLKSKQVVTKIQSLCVDQAVNSEPKFLLTFIKMTKYTLTYFDVEALGEPIRMLLSYGNLEFTDNRIDYEKDWAKFKTGVCKT